MTPILPVQAAGLWFYRKALKQAREHGVQPAARNLRKQGVPLALALLMLRRVRAE